MRPTPLLSALALGAAVALGAATGGPAAPHRIEVLAAVYPLADWAARVGGDRVSAATLTGAGGDPHGFEPTPADLRRLRQADVVLTVTTGFQPAVDRALRGGKPDQVRLVASRGLAMLEAAEHAHADAHDHGDAHGDAHEPHHGASLDPHFWLDPTLAKQVVGRIAAALAQADPSGKATYDANARAYQAELDALHANYGRTLAGCAHRELVTSHAAFGYLAARYGLEQAAISGISPEAEPTLRRLAELVQFVKRHRVKYVFTETVVSAKVAETLARETGAKTLVLHTLESLSEAEIARGKSYLGVMEDNLRALATGLECRAS